MELLRGRPVAERIDRMVADAASEIDGLKLAVYLIGADRSSEIYARSKVKKGAGLGIEVLLRKYGLDTDTDDIKKDLRNDAVDPAISGIMIERPLPSDINIHSLMKDVPPLKDVEGLHPENYGLLGMGTIRFIPPTPLGALMLMKYYDIEVSGKEVVILGRSPNVGRPLASLLSQKTSWGNGTVTLAHSRTKDLVHHTIHADVIVTAVGSARLMKGDMIKEGSILIDLGINPDGDGIVGDVDVESVSSKAMYATPTPGGTGPVTVSCMFLNLVRAWKFQNGDQTSFPDPLVSMIYKIK